VRISVLLVSLRITIFAASKYLYCGLRMQATWENNKLRRSRWSMKHSRKCILHENKCFLLAVCVSQLLCEMFLAAPWAFYSYTAVEPWKRFLLGVQFLASNRLYEDRRDSSSNFHNVACKYLMHLKQRLHCSGRGCCTRTR